MCRARGNRPGHGRFAPAGERRPPLGCSDRRRVRAGGCRAPPRACLRPARQTRWCVARSLGGAWPYRIEAPCCFFFNHCFFACVGAPTKRAREISRGTRYPFALVFFPHQKEGALSWPLWGRERGPFACACAFSVGPWLLVWRMLPLFAAFIAVMLRYQEPSIPLCF